MTQIAEFECDRRASVHLEDKALEEEQGSMKDSEAQADASRARMSNVSNESEHAEPSKAMQAIHKGQVRWVAKSGPVAQRQFIHTVFGIAE
jgi:hypothetical protein